MTTKLYLLLRQFSLAQSAEKSTKLSVFFVSIFGICDWLVDLCVNSRHTRVFVCKPRPFKKRFLPDKFENTVLSLRLGVPSTLIHHENRALRRRSLNGRNLKTPAFLFREDGKHFKNGSFLKQRCHDIQEIFSNTIPKSAVIFASLNPFGAKQT